MNTLIGIGRTCYVEDKWYKSSTVIQVLLFWTAGQLLLSFCTIDISCQDDINMLNHLKLKPRIATAPAIKCFYVSFFFYHKIIRTLFLFFLFKDDVFKAVPTPLSPPPAPATPVTPATPATPASSASPGTPGTPNSISPSGIAKRKTGQYLIRFNFLFLSLFLFLLQAYISGSQLFLPSSSIMNFDTSWGFIVFFCLELFYLITC